MPPISAISYLFWNSHFKIPTQVSGRAESRQGSFLPLVQELPTFALPVRPWPTQLTLHGMSAPKSDCKYQCYKVPLAATPPLSATESALSHSIPFECPHPCVRPVPLSPSLPSVSAGGQVWMGFIITASCLESACFLVMSIFIHPTGQNRISRTNSYQKVSRESGFYPIEEMILTSKIHLNKLLSVLIYEAFSIFPNSEY